MKTKLGTGLVKTITKRMVNINNSQSDIINKLANQTFKESDKALIEILDDSIRLRALYRKHQEVIDHMVYLESFIEEPAKPMVRKKRVTK